MDFAFVAAALAAVAGAFIPVVIGLSPRVWRLSPRAIRRLASIEVVIAVVAIVMGYVGQRWALQPAQGEGGLISLFIAGAGWLMMGIGALILIPGIAALSGASWAGKAHTAIAIAYAVGLVALLVLPI